MIRPLEWKDMKDLIENYYSYYEEVKESPDFGITFYHTRPSYDAEVDWFSSLYRDVLKEHAVVAVYEEEGKVVGLCEIQTVRPESELSHVGILGIAIKKGFRGKGMEGELIKKCLELAKGKFEIVKLEVFTSNESARRLYRKLGFVEYGILPSAAKRGKRYIDIAQMYYRISP